MEATFRLLLLLQWWVEERVPQGSVHNTPLEETSSLIIFNRISTLPPIALPVLLLLFPAASRHEVRKQRFCCFPHFDKPTGWLTERVITRRQNSLKEKAVSSVKAIRLNLSDVINCRSGVMQGKLCFFSYECAGCQKMWYYCSGTAL